ncbi:mechanosensitive ion channel family protein [Streptomyces verrucosisporus]|uniref:mechanosensitive ion channel family protein n=1 Tax=Streptomyces verrucosisporus TaxID=1695161 RepID=UPI001F127DF7|nr:mechanosensitive ion channel family protein [Streptomyces verrucosisporus]MBN3930661.1 mechanosensitive ion channel family protein [Streptomyces verrucosisporus]
MDEAHRTATDTAGWIEENWGTWLAIGLRIALILAIAVVLRSVVRRAITRLIARMNRNAEAEASGNALRGLLVNAERRRQRTEAIGSVLRSVTTFVIMGTALLIVLSTLGIDLAPLLASAGVAGVAIGFGARNLVTDVLTGMFVLLEDQYGVGDRIDAGEATGTVLEIGLRVTKLRGDDGEIWYVRNGEIKRVGNLSQGWATAALDVEVRSDEDLEEVRSAIAAAGEGMSTSAPWDEVLWAPVEVLGLNSVTLDTMVVRVSAKTMPGKALPVERELRWRVKRALDARGIRMVDEESLAALRKLDEELGAPPRGRGSGRVLLEKGPAKGAVRGPDAAKEAVDPVKDALARDPGRERAGALVKEPRDLGRNSGGPRR